MLKHKTSGTNDVTTNDDTKWSATVKNESNPYAAVFLPPFLPPLSTPIAVVASAIASDAHFLPSGLKEHTEILKKET